MFGEKLDYLLLRLLAHDRNIATEEKMNARSEEQLLRRVDDGRAGLRKHIRRFNGQFSISPSLRYLDMGWQVTFRALNSRLNSLPPLNYLSAVLTRIPVVRDYFVFSAYAILRRSPSLPHAAECEHAPSPECFRRGPIPEQRFPAGS